MVVKAALSRVRVRFKTIYKEGGVLSTVVGEDPTVVKYPNGCKVVWPSSRVAVRSYSCILPDIPGIHRSIYCLYIVLALSTFRQLPAVFVSMQFFQLYFVVFFPSHLYSPFLPCSLQVVTQIRVHIADSSPPSPLRHVPCIFFAGSIQHFLPSSIRVESCQPPR